MMQRVGRDIASRDRWTEFANSYADDIGGAYHVQRAKSVERLLPDLVNCSVIDFGCGEGVFARMVQKFGAREIVGIDPVEELLNKARDLQPECKFILGDVRNLADVASESIDCPLSLNVVAYLNEDEERVFYKEAARILKPGASLIVTHSNLLFDMFTLNKYTVDFYKNNFSCDVRSLLRNPEKPERITFNIRENALSYRFKMKALGFDEVAQEFMNFHRVPPLLSSEDPDDMQRARPDPSEIPLEERWKLPFQCSMFGSRCVRI